MKTAIIVIMLLYTGAAFAQAAFVPLTVDKADYDALRAWLMEQPTKFGAPVVQWLDSREAEAQARAKGKADAEVKEKAKEDMPPK